MADRNKLYETCEELRNELVERDKLNADFQTSLKAFESLIESVEVCLL